MASASTSLFVSAETIVDYYCWLVWCERKILFWLIIHDRLRASEQAEHSVMMLSFVCFWMFWSI